jgi:bifunctional NMN adenylyltransferase/nudix hydrolase
MSKPYKLSVVIGRFQFLHDAHVKLIEHAKTLGEKTLVLVGSSHEARSVRNPLTFRERELCLDTLDKSLEIEPLRDYRYNTEVWQEEVKQAISLHSCKPEDVCIVGYHKDNSSFYLDLFPEFKYEEYEPATKFNVILSSTTIRKLLFGEPVGSTAKLIYKQVPQCTKDLIWQIQPEAWLADMRNQIVEEQKYKKSWASAPFPPTFIAVDAIVHDGDELILIQRKGPFGKGLWAMAGGYIDDTETLLESAYRELEEETGINKEDVEFTGKVKVFDDPNRSRRGRMITHVHEFNLTNKAATIVAGDDAVKIVRVRKDVLIHNSCNFFSDHFHILFNMLCGKALINA